ncbi:conserved hypothetical protein [Methanocaldococcus sp. FS406-22]|uniref:hypothetical protein n=1 Tax=Methanocaldococcus sp. (strain FS406-22) TaxID=644281 RepID=UPI0001BF34F7|nr:hypothetical protein [Methanocaldococcus sp. FS406-22]ADC69817.1 conserved hypothetical protein [Methanocaldococcus sp. FS406-22]
MVIQQIIASILTFLLCFAYRNQIEQIGHILDINNDVLAWAVPTLIFLLCVWKIAEDKWGLGDALAAIVICILIMLYYTQDIGKIVLEISKIVLGISVGVIIGYLAKGDD